MSTTPIAKGGRRDRTTLSLTLKGHFSTKCSSANILNLVHEIKLIKMSRLTMSIRVLLQSNVVNDINLKIKVFPKQPLGTPIFKRFKNWGKRCPPPPRYQKAAWLRGSRLSAESGSGATTGGNGSSRLRVPPERGRRVQTAMFFYFV